jgi:ABC-2 type transport system permease protein
MLKIYLRTWQVVWAEQWQYRANLLMYLLFWVVTPVVFLAVWVSIANANGDVRGLTANDFISYYLVMLLVSVVTADITIHIFPYKIQDGSLSSELILPIHPVLTRALIVNLGFKALNLIVFIPAWLVLVLLFQPEFTITPWSAGLGVLACALGFVVNFFLGAIIACVAFWTERVYWIDQLVRYALGRLLSGEFVPLALLPGVVQAVALTLPFQLGIYFPVQVILNQGTPEQVLAGFGSQLAWSLVLIVIFLVQWRFAIRKYSAVGA